MSSAAMSKMAKVVVVCVITILAADLVAAQCPSPFQFRPCLQFVGSNGGAPDTACCDVVRDPKWTDDCLCRIATANYPGIAIVFAKAIALPKACGRYVGPGIYCNGVEVPY